MNKALFMLLMPGTVEESLFAQDKEEIEHRAFKNVSFGQLISTSPQEFQMRVT